MDQEKAAIYDEYLRTDHFEYVRASALQVAGGRCQVCSARGLLQVHHNSYENLTCEAPEDVFVLCAECHRIFHESGRLRGIELGGIDWGMLARYVQWESPEHTEDDSPAEEHVCIGCGKMIPVSLSICNPRCESKVQKRNRLGVPIGKWRIIAS